MEIQEALDIIEPIAKSFPEESREHEALLAASRALAFSWMQGVRNQFEDFVKAKERPLNGLELIKLRVYGIEIPDEQRTPQMMELAAEIDALAAKLRGEKT